MPVYKLNGQTYDIPDNVVSNFEKDNPSATVAYQVGKDVYDIPVSERNGFLSQFPDAVLEGQQAPQKPQQQQQAMSMTSAPQQSTQTPQGFGQRDQNLTRQMSLGKGPVSWEQPQQEPKQETDFDKAMRVTRGQGTEAENKQVQKRLQQRQDAITYKQETGDENGMNGDLLRQKVLNPEWEAATLSRDEYGNLRRGDDGKLLTGFSTDQDVVAASKQINDELASQQLALTKEEQAEVKLNEAYEERKKLQDEMAKLYQASLVDGNSKGAEDALNMLASAARQNEKSIIALEAEMADQGQGQFWQGFIDAAKDADTYTFGVTGLVDSHRLMSIKNKMDRGEQLTDAEQRLLQNTNLNNIAQSEFGSNRGALYRFGGISMQALPFIAEFMATGGFSALGNATTKGFTSMFGKYASKKFIQNTGIALGDIVAATAMANTTGAARTYSDIINRNIGDVVRDEKGNYAFEGGVGLGEAFYKGQVANTLEYYTEKLGEHLKLGQWLAKGADKAGLSKLSKAISYVSKNPWLERGGVQDYPSEVVEEQANLLLNAMLVGDNTFGSPDDPKSVINPETQTDIWGGMLFSIGLMQGPRFINTGRKYAGYKMYQTATNAASSRAEDVFSPDKWQAVKNQIDNTENQNLSEVLSQVITGNMTQEQKEATMFYAENLLKMRGYNVSLMNDLRDRDEDIAERGLNNSYMQGYNAKEPAQRQQINDAVAQSEAELSKYGNSFVYLVTDESNNPMAVLDFMSNNRTFFTDQQIQAATAYYMAKSSQQGVEDSDKEDADLAEASKSSRVSYTLKEQRVGGKWVVNSFDSKGNLIRSEEFDTKDDTDAFIGRVKMEQQMRAFNDYLNTQEVINNPQAIADFEAQNGWEPGTVANLAKSDPFRMSDEEWQMADQARDFLKGIAYPSTELHTETSAQDGVDTAEAVVEQVLSPEEPIDPQNNAGKEIREQFQAAEAALNQMFANDKTGDIEDHINSMKDSSPQEILSSLDTFRPEQRQVLIDYFNAKAKYDAFMNVAANKINEEAANSRQRHTFKGTIDGQSDLSHVHTITDGTNRYYLVSGDITTDPATGRITGSTSGLIIGMDLDGSFVQLNESDGYSVDPVNMSLDQFEEAERIRLQKAVSLTIDPNGAAEAAAGQAQQSGNLDNAGGEAGTDNGTGANEPPTPEPVNPTQPVNPPSPAGGEVQPQQPSVAIDSVTDKDGIKRYENGIAVDDAIADIQNDGFDVDEIADASIAEAQQAIDKIDKKQTKTRKDLMDKKSQQSTIDYYNNVKARWAYMNAEAQPQPTEQPQKPTLIKSWQTKNGRKVELFIMPETVDEDGNRHVKIGRSIDGGEISTGHANGIDVSTGLIDYEAKYAGNDEVEERDKEDGTRYIVTEVIYLPDGRILARGTIAGDKASFWLKGDPLAPAESEENVNVQPEAPNNPGNDVPLQGQKDGSKSKTKTADEKRAERILQLKEQYGEDFDDDFTKAQSADELASMYVGRNRVLSRESISQELGYKIGGIGHPLETLLAKTGEGMTTWEVAHAAYESDENPTTGDGEKMFSEKEIHDALIDVFRSAQTKADIMDYAVNVREERAKRLQEDRKRAEEEAQNPTEGVAPITDEEQARIEASLPFTRPEDGVDIPENPINALWTVIREVSQDGGMPAVRMVDTDQMTDGDWIDFASEVFDGAFVSDEDVNTVRSNAFEMGIVYNDATDTLIVFSGAVTPESLRENLEQFKQAYNETEELSDTDNEGLRDEMQDGESAETPAAEGANEPEGQGSPESVEDPYLQPRNAEEEQIIANVLAQLQQEIGDAVKERDDARSELQKAQVRESERATDLFGNDNALNQEGQLFDNSDMPVDNSVEGIERRTAPEREKLQEAVNQLNRLQSLEERNSRIRGALDNYRRQTKIETEEQEPVSDPIEAIEQAAQQFRQEQEEKKAYGADNKLVSKDRYEELKKKMKAKLLGQLNAGFDPEIISIGAEMAMFHVEAGARGFADFASRMINDLGDAIRPYLQGIYESAKRMPGMQNLRKEMDPTDVVDAFDVENFDKETSNNANVESVSVNVNKQEDNEAEKELSLQQKPASELEGNSAEFADRQYKLEQLSKKIRAKLQGITNWGDQPKPLSTYKQMAKELGIENLSDTDLQELIETEVVNLAREIAKKEGLTDEKKFQKIVKLYEGQPSLNARDNDRINKQQYSTPAPMAFLMGKFLKDGKKVQSGLEPSAGNGMLTVNLPKEKMHVNDIDEMRLSNLQKQGFGQVTSQDGTQPFEQKSYDVVVTNPPFGNTVPKTYDGIYEISGLEHQMAINALESMKDDGRAAIIIGGNTEYNQNGSIKGKDRIFLNYLYAHYNVVDVINMNGHELYSRQGTGYPVRMILINSRKEFNPNTFAPTIQKARAERVNSYDELYKRVNDDILSDSNKSAGVHDTESGEGRRVDDTSNAGNTTQTGVRNVSRGGRIEQHPVLDRRGQSIQGSSGRSEDRTDTEGRGQLGEGDNVVLGVGQKTTQPSGITTSQTDTGRRELSDGRDSSERLNGGVDVPVGGGSRPSVEVRRLGAEKVPYRQQSTNPYSLQSQMPAEQADVVKKALEELGNVDEFLVKELGYSSVEDLHHGSQSPENHGGLAAEQVDSVAMAIHQMNQGNAFIIGDQTGVGKGRQAAALIRYGVKKGGCPVFISVKKGLFSDMYRDLCDIGSPELRPFIWSADDDEHSADVTDKNGNVVYKRPSDKEQKRVVDYINKHGKLPPEYDYIVTTYDSFKGGTMTYEEGKKEPRKFAKGKSATTGAINSQAKRDALERLAENSYVIMDESHNAGGENSAVSGYLQYITTRAKGVTFLSATFAKRPGNMPIYSLKTAISKAGVKVGELIDAVKRGGATFQEIMSKALTEAGQMIRRERDMAGVTIDWRGIEDEFVIQKQREQYDQVIGLFNDIINFQRTYVDPIVDNLNDDAADAQGSVDHTPGTRDMGINNTPFASRTYNMVQQVLLSLKAEETAKRAIEHLKLGRKPVIALANTNEGAADEAAGASEESMEMPDLSVNLKKGLRGTLRITKKDAFGNSTNSEIPFERLSPEGQARYQEIMDAIESASTGLSLSPIDVIKNTLQKAGYKVGELTGRKAEFVYNEDGTVNRVKRADKDKKKIAADFNNGKLDALILNKSAGTGISLHASTKFDDQRQRIMIVAQAQGDVNDEVQIRGRIDRTGQVLRGMYEYVVSQIPSEQRLLMMLKAKLRSLDANTTSSQKSKFNEMQVQDIINKYGDDIVVQYLAEHTDLAEKMQNPLKWQADWQVMPAEQLIASAQKDGEAGKTASKVLGRMALLTVKEQEKMLSEIGELYQAEIDRLNEMGENDLEITEMPLKAKTLSKAVWEQGIEPGGKNPFADNTYVEKVNMDVLKKPMKGEEVKKSQERLLGGKTWEEYKQEQLEKVDKWEEQKKAETTETITERAKKKAEAEKEKYIKGAKKAQEKNGMTDEEIEKNGAYQYDTIYKQEMEKLDAALSGIEAQQQIFVDALETFNTDNVYAIPSNIYDLGSMTFEPGLGKLIDIKISDNFSTAASTITFATLDGRRKITIPISGRVKQQNNEKREIFPVINTLTAQTKNGMFGSNVANTLKVLEQNTDNWDRLTSTAARKDGYIITGNLLKALVSTREQGVGGKLISYTTDTGEVRQGILMPENFEPAGLTSKTPISSKKDELRYSRDKVESADGDVSIRVTGAWDWNDRAYNTLELTVPKSNKKGSKYFNDEVLLSLINGQFEGSGKMKAEFPRANLDAVMKRLDELGVTVAEDHNEEANARITTEDPMQAIEQASYAFRNEQGFYQRTNEELDEITKRVMDIPKRFGLKGGITQVINSRSELEQMKGKVSDEVYKLIEEGYNKKGVTGLHVSGVGIVVVFGEKVKDADDAEYTWWHEQTHNFWHSLPADLRDRYGSVCFNILQKYFPDVLDNVTGYSPDKWKNEACSFLVESIVKQYGADAFMTFKFGGNQNFINFANELREYLKNGTGQQQGHLSNNQRKGIGSISRGADAHRRDNLRQERKGSGSLLQAQSELQETEIVDPIEAIERAAADYRISKAEREEDMKDLRDESARLAYDDRINSIAFVNNEAFHDGMAGLKVGQEEIAHHKDIPDSQNAYMAENLMHGKNQVEQEAFNRLFRDPLYNAINKVLNRMEWTMKEMNRYLFTKHGLERNRELFTRDWLEAERKKRITEYSQLNTEEQEIYDKLANRIEEDFDDGIIETEEEKEKKLAQALQKAHNQHIEEVENKYYALKAENYDKLMNGEITLPEYFEKLDDYIRQNIDGGYVPEEHDYSGFTEMFGDEDGKYNEADIMANLMNDEEKMGKEVLDELWNRINLANQYGLDRYLEAGMRSEEEIEKIARMFNWYVPMRGFTEEKAEDMYQYFTSPEKANSYVGGLLKRARGRKSEAKDPIFTMIAMTYKAIKDCNQNMVNQKFYRLIQANPNDLAIVSDAWAKWSEDAGAWVEVAPEFPDDATEEQIKQITLDWEDEMRHLAMGRKARKINGKADFVYKPLDKKKLDEHVVEVRMNGQKRRVTVVGNPRMAQALNGQTRYSEGDGIISKSKWFGWAPGLSRRFLKMRQALNTNYSLSFVWRNAKRDWTHFGALLAAKEGLGYAKAAEGYYFKSLRGMRKLFKKYREGTLDDSIEIERDFKDYMDNGGITGFVQMQKVDEIQKDFEKLSKQLDKKGEIKLDKGFWNKIKTAIEAYNEAIENRARFATYRASRHYAGRTKARSAYDAKEVTANFNRRGAGKKTVGIKGVDESVLAAALIAGRTSQLLNENRMFFNATVQSLATLGEGIKVADNKTRAKIFAKELAKRMVKYGTLPLVLSQLIILMNEALIYVLGGGDDDDPYANLPEWVRRNNICIYIGNGNFFTFALGQELAAFYSLGDIIAGLTYYPELKPVDKDLKDELVGILSVFSPVDMETKVARDNAGFAETAFVNAVARVYSNYAPFIQVIENTAWTGRPIYREDRYNGEEFKPEHKMAFRGTPKFYKYVSEGLNYIGGGDEGTRGAEWSQVNPGIMEYLVEQYAGGAGRFFVNTGDVAGDAVRAALHKDQDFNVRKLEGFRALFQQSDDRTQYYRAQVKYWKYHKEADKLDHDIDYYRKDAATNPESYMKAMELSQGDDAARLLIFKETDGDMSKLRKAINSSEGQDRKNLQKLYNQNIKIIVDALDDPKKAPNNLPVQ